VSPQEIGTDLVELIRRTGREVSGDLAAYAAARTSHLATMVGSPGFYEALAVERDNVALRAGVLATQAGDAIDRKIVGLIEAALAIGARAMLA
jgi:hypothetical protein